MHDPLADSNEHPGTEVAVVEGKGARLLDLEPEPLLQGLEGPGTVLLRGFQADLLEYEAFSRKFCERFHRVAARDQLRDREGDGLTARAPTVNFTLLVHNEGTYRPFEPPDLAFFRCLVAPSRSGGEAILVDGRAFLQRLPEELRSRFETGGAIFDAFWDPGRWRAEFSVDTMQDVESLCRRHPGLDCHFEDANLRYSCRRSVIQPDRLGEPVFANAILAHLPDIAHPAYRHSSPYVKASNGVRFGDGEALGDDVVNTLIDIQDEVAYEHRFQKGDLLLIDNTRVMHGRRPTQGDCPRVLLTRFGYLRGELRGS